MLILALDTTTRPGSVAIIRDGRVLHEHSGHDARTHGQRLPGDLIAACQQAGVTIQDIDGFAVAAGPGSFTGLRIGIATIQGLAMAVGRPVIPVSSLEAIAAAAPAGPSPVAAWMDAQRTEVFAQVFERRADACDLSPVDQATVAPPARLMQLSPHQAAQAFWGDGAVRYADVIRSAAGHSALIATEPPALAGAVGRLAFRHRDRAVLPHAVVPIYVRRPDAELARDRRAERP